MKKEQAQIIEQTQTEEWESVYIDFLNILRDHVVREMSEKSGIGVGTITHWRYHDTAPSLPAAAKLLDCMGYELKIVRKENYKNEVRIDEWY